MSFLSWALFWAQSIVMSETDQPLAQRAFDPVRGAWQSPRDRIPGRLSGTSPLPSGPTAHTCCLSASCFQISNPTPLTLPPITNNRTSPGTPWLRGILQKGATPGLHDGGTLPGGMRVPCPHPSLCCRNAGVFWNGLALPISLLALSGLDLFIFVYPLV